MRTVSGGGAWELKGRAEGINTYLTNAPNFADIKVTLSHSTSLLGQWPAALLHTFPFPKRCLPRQQLNKLAQAPS